jgi:hypothetical protein
MKKICLIALILFVACKKSADSTSTQTVGILVKDAANSQPVSGASVLLRRCANAGCAFGEVTEFQGTTDANGILHVPGENYNNVPVWNDAIYVIKENYWPQFFSKSTTVSITPYGWARVRIISGTNYPQGSQLKMNVFSANQPLLSAHEFETAADSSIIISGFGNEVNRIEWQVYGNSTVLNSGVLNQQFPRLDTLQGLTLNY